MNELPTFISDLALILVVAGIVSILFKRLRQPLVLGYLVAGFLTGPHMPYTPSVHEISSIDTWADIGIIFFMFSLGLEFSMRKILSMGTGPVIAACTIMIAMMGIGSLVGQAFGWTGIDSLFLGGMLAMSSTTIIFKAFTDLKLMEQRFAKQVLSVLVLEDILGILLMVILASVAQQSSIEGEQLLGSFLRLGFMLILWFVVGIFLLPILLRRARRWMNHETLLIVSLALCFVMVVLATHFGYSAAFGAFMMGSILSETVEAEHIGQVTEPVKNLFGAIFFVSVGMLVDPAILVQYAVPIGVLTLTILVSQAIFGTGGFLLAGQPLPVAMQCGFSLAQIGEFAFIIAAMGVSLGVMSSFLYPVVVAVSVITTFLTPYMIRLSGPAYTYLQPHLPTFARGTQHVVRTPRTHGAQHRAWITLLTALVRQTLIYTILSIATIAILFGFLLPLSRQLFTHWVGNAVCGLAILVLISFFLRAIMMRKNHSHEFRYLWGKAWYHRPLLLLTLLLRVAVCAGMVYYILDFLSPLSSWLHLVVSVLVLLPIVLSRFIKKGSILLERVFKQNIHSREILAQIQGKVKPLYASHLLSRDVHMAVICVPPASVWCGRSLRELNLAKAHGVLVSSILRGGRRINIPTGDTILMPEDRLQSIGDDPHLKAFAQHMETQLYPPDLDIEHRHMHLRLLVITADSPFCNQRVQASGIRERYQCMIVGFEEGKENLGLPTAQRIFQVGDVVWLVGEHRSLDTVPGITTYNL